HGGGAPAIPEPQRRGQVVIRGGGIRAHGPRGMLALKRPGYRRSVQGIHRILDMLEAMLESCPEGIPLLFPNE
ncbi:MAG TPA: hypothetical protein VEH57_05625, partial [Thermoplasmata archaeon]|nr:hypothetical protein [Thermoplasmata archaeon]